MDTRAATFRMVSLAGLLALALLQGSCGGGEGEIVPAAPATVNAVYLDSLARHNYLSHAAAQPPAEVFVRARHFALASAGVAAGAPGAAGAVLYRPAYLAAALPGAGADPAEIPGFKPGTQVPAACRGLADDAFKTCLEANPGEPAAAPHQSSFDGDALRVLLGDSFETALAAKVVNSLTQHVDEATRAQVLAVLTDYINDAPAHGALDLAQHAVFAAPGYRVTHVTFTDGARADVDGDGALDNHTALIVEVSKPLAYVRAAAPEVDPLLRGADGQLPQETYSVHLQAHVHLADLAALRQGEAASVPASEGTDVAAQESADEGRWMNMAADANILRRIVDAPGPIPWESSEYVVSFQVSQEAISGTLGDALARAVERGDDAAAQALEHHLNASSAIITGGMGPTAGAGAAAVDVFYQASQPRSVPAAWAGANLDYGMFDAAGNRIALVDPTSGEVVLAGERPRSVAARQGLLSWTKPGACQGDRNYWSYGPSQVRTERFGRGIQWILTEWLLHNQVGDYKNIHWWQSAWKAGAQVAIKSGMWVVKNYLQYQFANAQVPAKDDRKYAYTLYYLLDVVMPYMTDFISDGQGGGKTFHIAGWSHRVDGRIIRAMIGGSSKNANPTFAGKVGYAVVGFLIDRASDGLGQSLDVTVTGWQDYSDGSHYGCFEFSY